MKELIYQIEGTTPMLMHNVECMAVKKPEGITYEEWERHPDCYAAKMYKQDKSLAIPARVIRGLLIASSKKSGLKPPKKRTYTDMVKSVLFFLEPSILDQTPEQTKPHSSYVRIGTQKILRIWPKLDEWKAEVKITLADPKMMSVEAIDALFEYAGKYVGLGDYRPEFGRFKVKRLK